MAAPNLKSPTTVTGKTTRYAATTTLAEALSNPANSGKVLRINVARIANVAASGSISVDISHHRGSTHSYLLKNATVAQSSSLVVLQRDEYIYLEEGDAIYVKTSASSSADVTFAYEEWS